MGQRPLIQSSVPTSCCSVNWKSISHTEVSQTWSTHTPEQRRVSMRTPNGIFIPTDLDLIIKIRETRLRRHLLRQRIHGPRAAQTRSLLEELDRRARQATREDRHHGPLLRGLAGGTSPTCLFTAYSTLTHQTALRPLQPSPSPARQSRRRAPRSAPPHPRARARPVARAPPLARPRTPRGRHARRARAAGAHH